MVRLLQVNQTCGNSEAFCFNPTMVRLLHHRVVGKPRTQHMFQSHNGAIAADAFVSCPAPVRWSFNPTMVRLLPFTLNF